MSVQAAQLVAEVTISGADTAINNLTQIGAATDTVQTQLNSTGEAANNFAGMFQSVSQALTEQQQAISADGEAFMSLQDAISQANSMMDEQVYSTTSDGEAVVGLGKVMADLAAQADETAAQIAAESEAQAQAASAAAYLALTEGGVAPAFEEAATAATSAAGATTEAGNAASEASNGGFLDLFNRIGFSIFNFQNYLNMAKQVAQGLLEPAVSAETVTTALTTLDGSAAKAAQEMANLNAFAAKTPFKTLDIDQAAEQLQGFGYNASQVIPMIQSIGDALGSVGKETPAQLMSVVDIFGKMRTEGKVTAMTMNELAVHGIDAWKAMADGSGKTIPQLQDMVKKGLLPASDAVKWLTAGIEKNPLYAGGMAKAAGTFSGLLSTLQSNWDQVIAAFGTPVIKALEGSLSNLGNILASPSFQQFAGNVGKGIVDVFKNIGGAVSNVVGYFSKFDLTGITYSFKNLGDAVGGLLSPLKSLGSNKDASAFFSSLKDSLSKDIVAGIKNVSGFINTLADDLRKLGSNKDVTGFVNSLKDGFGQVAQIVGGQLGQNFQTFGKTIQQVGQWFQTSMLPAIQQAMPGFLHLASAIATNVVPALAQIWAIGQQVARQVMPPLIQAFETVAPIVVRVGGFIADNLGKALQFIMPFAVQAAQTLGQFAGEIMSRVVPMVQNLWDTISTFLNWIKPYWPAIWGGIQAAFTMVWDTIKGVIQIAWSIVSGTIKVGLDILSGNWKKAWDDIKSALSGVWDGIKSIVSGAWALVSAPITNGLHTLENTWNTIWNNIKSTFSNVWNSMQGLASGAWNGIAGAIKGGINNVIGMINGFINNLDSIHISLPGGGSVGFSIPDIPYLAAGGTAVRGGAVVVGDEGPELMYMPAGAQVIPNNQAFGQPNIIVQPAPVYLDGRQLMNGLMPYLVNGIRYGSAVRF